MPWDILQNEIQPGILRLLKNDRRKEKKEKKMKRFIGLFIELFKLSREANGGSKLYKELSLKMNTAAGKLVDLTIMEKLLREKINTNLLT